MQILLGTKNINNKNLDSVIVNLEKKFKNINQKNETFEKKPFYQTCQIGISWNDR